MPQLRVKASLDRSEYEKGLDAMKNASKGLNNSLQSLGGIGGVMAGVFGGNVLSSLVSKTFGLITSSIGAAQDDVIRLGEASENIGIDPEMLGEATRTFKRFGQSGDVVVSMFGRLAAARDKALGGNEKMVNAFKELGLSMDKVAAMPIDELFRKIAGRYASSTGSTRAAAGDIMGRGLRAPGASRAFSAYGSGEIPYPTSSPTGEEAVQAELTQRAIDRGWKGIGNSIVRFFGTVHARLNSVSSKDIEEEIINRGKEAKNLRKENMEALKRQNDRDTANKAALETESDRYNKDQEAERKDELEHGLHLQRSEADSYRRRGILVGGGAINDQAYATGRRQVQLMEQLLESSRRIEAHTAVEKRHKEALANIKNQYVAGDFEPGVE